MEKNQNPEVNTTSTIEEAQASVNNLPVKELVPATTEAAATAEPKSKKAKKNKAAKAKKAAKEALTITMASPEETEALKKTLKVKKTKDGGATLFTKEVKLKKKKSAKDKAVDETAEAQKPSIMEEVISHRDVKYIYPEDVVDTLSRKTWRQKTRNKLRQLERDMLRISDQNSKEYKKAKKAYEEFKSQVLKPAQAV